MASSIVSTYYSLLRDDPDLTMPVAAIESLVHFMAANPSISTVSETDVKIKEAAEILKRAIPNAISLTAGTDLFTRYLTHTFTSNNSGADFKAIRQHLVSNGHLFVSRAKEARRTIAEIAKRFVREGSTILTNGGSRVVGAVLIAAAEAQARESGTPRFRVIYTTSSFESAHEGTATISALRALSVPVATIPESAVAYSMSAVTMALVGAEGVVENGGVISRLGTYQLAILARNAGKPVYVVAESHKFVRLFPLGQDDLNVKQNILHFTTEDANGGDRDGVHMPRGRSDTLDSLSKKWKEGTPRVDEDLQEYFDNLQVASPARSDSDRSEMVRDRREAVDYTPPDLITALITEAGVLTPSAVSEDLIKIWQY